MDLFDPASKSTDVLIEKILTPLFGYNTDKALFFAQPMEVFLQGCLILVAILFLFNVITDTTNTANTGALLGKKGDLTWNVLRNVIGVGLLFPIKGLAAAQYIFIWLAAQGLLLANSIYEKMDWLDSNNSNLAFISNVQGDLLKSYRSAVVANACVLSGQQNATVKANGDRYKFSVSKGEFSLPNEGKTFIYKYGDFSTNVYKDNTICGNISISFPVVKKGETLNIHSAIDELENFSLIDTEKVGKALQAAHLAAMNDLLGNKARATAQMILQGSTNEQASLNVANKIQADLKAYEDSIRQNFNTVSKVNDDVKSYMTKYGIASGGAWIWAISNSQASITNIVNNTPKVLSTFNTTSEKQSCSGFSYFSIECKKSEELNSASSKILADTEKAIQVFNNAEKAISNELTGADSSLAKSALQAESSDDNSNKFLKMFSGLSIKGMTTGDVEGLNPLVVMQGFGQKILLAAEGIIALLLTASFFSSMAVSAIIAGLPLLLSIIIPAIMIVFYFPFLPFIIWFGNIIGWIVMIVQGLLGIPLWLVSFIRNDTDNFIGKTGQGYLLILEAFLRPSLMIFALFFSFNLLVPVVNLLNFFFLFVGNSIYSNTNGFLVLFYYVFMIVIYTVLVNKVLRILFGLIETIPDKILVWIGSNINSIMSNAGKELDNLTDKAVQGNLGIASGASGLAGNAVAKAGDAFIKRREAKKPAVE